MKFQILAEIGQCPGRGDLYLPNPICIGNIEKGHGSCTFFQFFSVGILFESMLDMKSWDLWGAFSFQICYHHQQDFPIVRVSMIVAKPSFGEYFPVGSFAHISSSSLSVIRTLASSNAPTNCSHSRLHLSFIPTFSKANHYKFGQAKRPTAMIWASCDIPTNVRSCRISLGGMCAFPLLAYASEPILI